MPVKQGKERLNILANGGEFVESSVLVMTFLLSKAVANVMMYREYSLVI